MNENELFEAWEERTSNEQKKLQETQVQLKNIAQLKSADIFQKIYRNMIWELIITIPLTVVFPFLFWNDNVFFWLILALCIVSILIAARIYLGYIRDLKRINDENLIDSLEKKIKVLNRYVKQLNLTTILLGPIGFGVGVSFGLKPGEIDLAGLLILSLICIPVLFLLVWLSKKYIHQLYGKHLNYLKEMYASLIGNEV